MTDVATRAWIPGEQLAVGGVPRRIVPLVLGYEPISESVSVAGGRRFRYLMEPVTAAAIVFDFGWVLIDGGFDPANVADDHRRAARFSYRNYTPVVPGTDPLRDQIRAAGLSWSDLAAALLTHAHFDHTGAARMLKVHQPLVLQRREWEHVCAAEDPRAAFLFRDDFDHLGLSVLLVDGDTSLAPGLRALYTPGHTPGHQSISVELPEETVILAGDAADLRRNVELCIPCGSTVGPNGPDDAQRSIDRLHALDREGAIVWPAHDPDWGPWARVIDAQP
ncbi:N-acyl homoserine lactonase family protein [Microbacterium sediminicola]|uniref:N-acyl homoserine lactonase family protein n=2 Tax=Microbacterium sediminicola TaxID=415210 RepID=A0ABP4THT7_9MICO